MKTQGQVAKALVVALAMAGGLVAMAQPKGESQEQERKVKAAEVPKAALEALKKLAAGAEITQFEEEIEHGDTYYEGSWKGPHGNVDAVVTAQGDLVEIEEVIPAEVLPKGVLAAVRKDAGSGVKLMAEKKTAIYYEVKFTKDGKRHEILYTPTGRVAERETEDEGEESDD